MYEGRYFVVRLTADEVALLDPTAVAGAGYRAYRWWSPDELDTTDQTLSPGDLPTLVRTVLAP